MASVPVVTPIVLMIQTKVTIPEYILQLFAVCTNLLGILLPSCLVRRVRKVSEVVEFLHAGAAVAHDGVELRVFWDGGRAA